MKFVLLIVIPVVLFSCTHDPLPYEVTFKKAIISKVKIEPIVESIKIDTSISPLDVEKSFRNRFEQGSKNQVNSYQKEVEAYQS